jgi:carboxypeptidase D
LMNIARQDRERHQLRQHELPLSVTRSTKSPSWLNDKTKGAVGPNSTSAQCSQVADFAVDGTSFPGVPFDIGESYAGLLPITADKDDRNEIFFWFFPSKSSEAKKEVVIWFQGGPGCSSLVALLQENGPFLWQPGVYQPYANPYSWDKLTNVVWVDQPYGIGLAQGNTTVKDPTEAAQQFMGFWKNFVKTFSMQGFKIHLVGESYGGSWVSYLASGMLEANDTKNYDLKTIQLQDAFIGNLDLQTAGEMALVADPCVLSRLCSSRAC